MIDIQILVCLLFAHWVADFVLQDDWMAKNKSDMDTFALEIHCLIYSVIFWALTHNILFACWLGVAHFAVDFVTSRINKHLWDNKHVHYFFVSVGFDQFIHFVVMVYLWKTICN